MTTLYLIRHATTDANVQGIFQGSLELPLNDQGRSQVEYLRKRFTQVPLDLVVTSPQGRAYSTALGVKGSKDIPLLKNRGLREVEGGLLEGQGSDILSTTYAEEMRLFREDPPHFQAPEGESCHDVYVRMIRTINKILRRNQGKKLACVSHGYAIQTFLNYAHGRPFAEMRRDVVNNTAVSKFTFDDKGRLTICYIGDDSHLPPELRVEQQGSFMADE